MVIFLERATPKVTISQLCMLKFLIKIVRHINNSILKNTLQMKILWTYMDQDMCQFFYQEFSKQHETKTNKVALNIVIHEKKM